MSPNRVPSEFADRQRSHSPVLLGASHLTEGMGGIASVARLTARTMLGMGQDVDLLTLLDAQDGSIGGCAWSTCRGARLRFLARCHFGATSPRHYIYDSAGIARAHPRLLGLRRPYALWMHGIEVWHGLQRDHERVIRRANLAIVNSNTTLDRFHELHGELATAKVCWLATEADEPPDIAPSFSGRPVVFALGTITVEAFHKGHRELVESWPHVIAAVPQARLVFAGGGNGVGYLRELVSRSSAAASIEVLGFVQPQDLPSLWARAHVFALPSRKEGFGIVYAEAMRNGIPVVASVHDAGREVNVDGKTGYNVDLDRPGELAERLVALLKMPDLATRLGANGKQRWREHFRFSAFERRLQAILDPFLSYR